MTGPRITTTSRSSTSGSPIGASALDEGANGIAALHALIADHLDDRPIRSGRGGDRDRPRSVGASTAGRGLHGLCDQPAAGLPVRERHGARAPRATWRRHVLAELVRLDRDHHRPIAGDRRSRALKVVARAHQSMVWSRQRQTNTLLDAARVLPRRARRLRRPGRPRCAGGLPCPDPGCRAPVAGGAGGEGAARGRAPTQPPATAQRIVETLHGEQLEAHRRGRGLRREREGAGRGDHRAGPPVRGPQRRGGGGFWPAPGR